MVDHLDTQAGRKIAYCRVEGSGPGVVFLGGFRSDMTGTKAQYLETWAKRRGRSFLRFDYSGHGESSGRFVDGCIGDWADDAEAAIRALTVGPQILVGSSMGGWISLLMSKRIGRIAGLVGIAAAPDFTEDSMWASFDDEMRSRLERDGQIELPSDYADGPYIITKRLIEEGRHSLVLREPLTLPFRVRLLQGMADSDVDMSVALRLAEHAEGDDLQLTLVAGADHRFSTPDCLDLLSDTLDGM